MPDGLAGAKIADRLAVLDDVGNDVDFGELLVERLAIRVRPRRIEFAKLPAESKKLRVREALAPRHDDQTCPPRLFDCAPNPGETEVRLDRCHRSRAPSGASRFLIDTAIDCAPRKAPAPRPTLPELVLGKKCMRQGRSWRYQVPHHLAVAPAAISTNAQRATSLSTNFCRA